MLKPRCTITLLALGVLTGIPLVRASGTYPPAPPRLGADITQSIDPAAYNLGKSIFTGRANLDSPASASATRISLVQEKIQTVVGKIPARAQTQLDVPTLARSLDQVGVDALLYYLRLRFRVTEDNA